MSAPLPIAPVPFDRADVANLSSLFQAHPRIPDNEIVELSLSYRCAGCHCEVVPPHRVHVEDGVLTRMNRGFCRDCTAISGERVAVHFDRVPLAEDVERIFFRKLLVSWAAGNVIGVSDIKSHADVFLLTAFLSLLVYNFLAPDPPAADAEPGGSDQRQREEVVAEMAPYFRHCPSTLCGVPLFPLSHLFERVCDTRMKVGAFGHGRAGEVWDVYADGQDLAIRFKECLIAAHFCHRWILARIVPIGKHAFVWRVGSVSPWHSFSVVFADHWVGDWEARIADPATRALKVVANAAIDTPGVTKKMRIGLRLLQLAHELAASDRPVGRNDCGASAPENVRNVAAILSQLAFHYGKAYVRPTNASPPSAGYAVHLTAFVEGLRHMSYLRNAITVSGTGEKGKPFIVTATDVDLFCLGSLTREQTTATMYGRLVDALNQVCAAMREARRIADEAAEAAARAEAFAARTPMNDALEDLGTFLLD